MEVILAAGFALGLVAYGTVTNLRPTGGATYVVRNLVTGVVLVVVARSGGISWDQLGLDPADLGPGLRWGWLAVLVVAVAVATGGALADRVPGVGALLSDRRAELEPGELAFHVLLRIPVGTALFEEVAFRGVLLGAGLAAVPTAWAVALSSVAFGLWHVAPTRQALDLNGVADVGGRRRAVAGAVVATTVAGAALCLLRLVSGSIVAPVLAHAAVNVLGLLSAALFQRTGGRRASGGAGGDVDDGPQDRP